MATIEVKAEINAANKTNRQTKPPSYEEAINKPSSDWLFVWAEAEGVGEHHYKIEKSLEVQSRKERQIISYVK